MAINLAKYFHISFNSNLSGVWKPQIPAGYEITKKNKYSEPDTPRISLAPSLEQCFFGVYPNISNLVEVKKYPHLTFLYYKPVPTGKEKIWDNSYLTENRLVHDAHVTGEICVLTPMEMVLSGTVTFYVDPSKDVEIKYHPFNDTNEPEKFLSYKPHKIVVGK